MQLRLLDLRSDDPRRRFHALVHRDRRLEVLASFVRSPSSRGQQAEEMRGVPEEERAIAEHDVQLRVGTKAFEDLFGQPVVGQRGQALGQQCETDQPVAVAGDRVEVTRGLDHAACLVVAPELDQHTCECEAPGANRRRLGDQRPQRLFELARAAALDPVVVDLSGRSGLRRGQPRSRRFDRPAFAGLEVSVEEGLCGAQVQCDRAQIGRWILFGGLGAALDLAVGGCAITDLEIGGREAFESPEAQVRISRARRGSHDLFVEIPPGAGISAAPAHEGDVLEHPRERARVVAFTCVRDRLLRQFECTSETEWLIEDLSRQSRADLCAQRSPSLAEAIESLFEETNDRSIGLADRERIMRMGERRSAEELPIVKLPRQNERVREHAPSALRLGATHSDLAGLDQQLAASSRMRRVLIE